MSVRFSLLLFLCLVSTYGSYAQIISEDLEMKRNRGQRTKKLRKGKPIRFELQNREEGKGRLSGISATHIYVNNDSVLIDSLSYIMFTPTGTMVTGAFLSTLGISVAVGGTFLVLASLSSGEFPIAVFGTIFGTFLIGSGVLVELLSIPLWFIKAKYRFSGKRSWKIIAPTDTGLQQEELR